MAPTFNGLSIAVADMATSLSFYRRLGLDFPPGAENEPHVEVELPGGIRLMWDHNAAEATGGGPNLAFLCQDATEVDTVYAELEKAGHVTTKEPWDAPWGQRYAVVQDPDGCDVDLFAWLKTD